MAFPVIMHINYCEQGQSIHDVCRKAADWGFDGVEFRRKRMEVGVFSRTWATEAGKESVWAG